jgi:acyl-CoA reductase-like NAD-dependent aldehyde dehydrogenase
LAPDYILVHRDVEHKLVDKLNSTLKTFYGDNIEASSDFGRIVNRRHFDRVSGLLESAGGEIAGGGKTNAKDLYIAPTLIRSPKLDAPIMKEEIFGAISV